jgi:hypothetical protein
MAHFAELDENNVVINVIVVGDEYESTYAEWRKEFGETYVQTSYNNNIRKQYAGIGFTYDPIADVFISPQPFPSWTLDSNYDWQPPIAMPEYTCSWDEETKSWINLS